MSTKEMKPLAEVENPLLSGDPNKIVEYYADPFVYLLAKWNSSIAKDVKEPFTDIDCYGWNADYASKKLELIFKHQEQEKEEGIPLYTPFLVGNDYYEIVETPTRNGETKLTLEYRKEKALSIKYPDFKEKVKLGDIRKFHKFVNVVNFVGHKQIIGGCYNEFPKPNYLLNAIDIKGVTTGTIDIKHSLYLLHHIFGSQWYLGLQYLALLIQKPNQSLPVLCLVSKENQTGKSTFANMLHYLLGDCVGFYSMADLRSDFNQCFLSHVAIFEEISSGKKSIDTIKDMATTHTKVINKKGEQQREYEVCPHIIINSNNETGFITATKEDIRYWVIKVPAIPIDCYIPNFDEQLRKEAKAFFYFLATFPHLGERRSRMWFSKEDIHTAQLEAVRNASKSDCAKDIVAWSLGQFDSGLCQEFFYATAKELYEYVPCLSNKYKPNDIRRALKMELGMETQPNGGKNLCYTSVFTRVSVCGMPFRFDRENLEKYDL